MTQANRGRAPIEAYPLTWPDGWTRTPVNDRRYSAFKVSFAKARDHLYREVELLGGKKAILSTNVELKWDGTPKGNAREPVDTGVALYFEYKGKPMCFACDKFWRAWENIRAIGLTIESLRAIERYGASDMMERAFKGFTAIPERAGEWWREVLGFQQEQKVTAEDVEREFRRLAHVAHPDKGGTVEVWNQLVMARENARKDLGVTR